MVSYSAKLAVVMALQECGPVTGPTVRDIKSQLGLDDFPTGQVHRALLSLHFGHGVVEFVRPRIGSTGSERLGEVKLLIKR